MMPPCRTAGSPGVRAVYGVSAENNEIPGRKPEEIKNGGYKSRRSKQNEKDESACRQPDCARSSMRGLCGVYCAFRVLRRLGGGSGSTDPWEEPESPGSSQNPDNPDPEQPDNPNPDQPEEQKSISELLKELITNYDSLAGSSEITLSAQSIKAVGSVFFAESTVSKETIQNAIQDSGVQEETEAALVAQAEGNMKMQKSGAQYTFSKADCKLVFTGEFDIDETYLIIEDGFLDVDLSGATLSSKNSQSVQPLFIDFNPEVNESNIINVSNPALFGDWLLDKRFCPVLQFSTKSGEDGEIMRVTMYYMYADAIDRILLNS